MEDLNAQILWQGYGLKLISFARTRTGLLCKTNAGMKELKKTRISETELEFVSRAKEHLYNKGFKNIDIYNQTIYGKPYYIYDENAYILEDYIESQRLDTESEENILKASETLASLHSASKGFSCNIIRSNIGKLPIIYDKRKTELMKVKKWINNQSNYSRFDILVLKNYDFYKDKAEKAKHILKGSKYNSIVQKAQNEKTFCHNAYKSENIRVLNENNELYIKEFDNCAYDCCIVDLADFIRRYMKGPQCSAETIFKIIEAYNSVKSISNEELEVLYGLLNFPSKFFKIINNYYNKRKVCVSDFMVQRLERCVAQKDKNEKILNELNLHA